MILIGLIALFLIAVFLRWKIVKDPTISLTKKRLVAVGFIVFCWVIMVGLYRDNENFLDHAKQDMKQQPAKR